MRWLNTGIGIAVVALLALNLRTQFAVRQRLDALASAAPAVAPPAQQPAAMTKQAVPGPGDDAYVIEAPDVLTVELHGARVGGFDGPCLVRHDGTINLGPYGSLGVAGATLAEARRKLTAHLAAFADRPTATLGVQTCNSKFFYVITQAAGGERLERRSCFGNETVLDAVGAGGAKGSPMHIARRSPTAGEPWQVLPIDWAAIRRGETATNYQLLPGDRVYVAAAN